MLQLPVVNQNGEQTGELEIDPADFGGAVRPTLLKQAIVMHLANRRQGTVATKSRSDTAGSTRKIYRQKGTGRARMGTVRNPIRTGGGVAHAKRPVDHSQRMPAKARRRALDSALLDKFQSGRTYVLESLELAEIKTRPVAEMLGRLKIAGSCLLVIAEPSEVIWKSARNVSGLSVAAAGELFAYGVAAPKTLLITRAALDGLLAVRRGAARPAAAAVETT